MGDGMSDSDDHREELHKQIQEANSRRPEIPKVAPAIARERVLSDQAKLQEKFDAQKKILQRFTLQLLVDGQTAGLTGPEVKDLREALEVLGWLPRDVKV